MHCAAQESFWIATNSKAGEPIRGADPEVSPYPAYRAGPTRKVPGRKGMTWEEEDRVDEEATAHRGPDE